MKKLMMFAAAATLVGAASAAVVIPGGSTTNCNEEVAEEICGFYGFTFKGAGKTATYTEKKGYKSAFSVSLKGGLGINFAGDVTNGCCTLGVTLAFKTKIGGNTYRMVFNNDGEAENFTRFSMFGKNIETVMDIIDLHEGKAGKFYTVESDLGFESAGDTGLFSVNEGFDAELAEETAAAYYYFSGFGSAKVGLSKGRNNTASCGDNSEAGCEPLLKDMNYKGYFAGYFEDAEEDLDVLCFRCECEDNVIFGGTWSAKFNEKIATRDAMISAALK